MYLCKVLYLYKALHFCKISVAVVWATLLADRPGMPGASKALRRLSEAGVWIRIIALGQPYNGDLPPPRATTWEQAESQVYEHLAAHQGTVQHQLPTFEPSTDRLDGRSG